MREAGRQFLIVKVIAYTAYVITVIYASLYVVCIWGITFTVQGGLSYVLGTAKLVECPQLYRLTVAVNS
jgi:hypothetical protein